MKKTLLWSLLFLLISSQIQAESTHPTDAQTNTITSPPLSSPPDSIPAAAKPTSPPSMQKPDVDPNSVPTGPEPTSTKQEPKPASEPISCNFKIPAETKKLDQSLVLSWSEKAVLQSFDLDHTSIDRQMQNLQPCFTEQGWIGFNNALQKSGNVDAIKAQKLNVSSQIDGQPEVTELKENQWKVNLPLQVVYQNDKEKVTQLLQISLTVGRKTSGDLGIMQMIATPRVTEAAPQSTPKTSLKDTPNDAEN